MIQTGAKIVLVGLGLFAASVSAVPGPTHVVVASDGTGDFKSVQEAIDAAPPEGSVIRVKPGVYREVLVISKPHIELRGMGTDPARVVLTYPSENRRP